jgi:hypothetical protein
MSKRKQYNREAINTVLEETLSQLGPEKFSHLGVVELEAVIRSHHPNQPLPGRTIFREIIHAFRKSRWPESAPRTRSRLY